MILNESLLVRLEYLFMQPSKPGLTAHKETCPYCSMPTDNHDMFCHFCGINLNYDIEKEENHLMEFLQFDHEKNGDEDIRYITYKFLKMLEENIEFEYAIFMVENNYNISYGQLNNYLKQNNFLANKKITPQGLKFMKNHPLHYYEKYELDLLNYNEFEKYFYEHSYLTCEEICLKLLDEFDDDE